ncbi:MAG TPA: M24 family metallopeptidase [Gemmatimonadales bacterium]|nr:M24 family metallopeptidase [Gemmatimonadales bacterium]
MTIANLERGALRDALSAMGADAWLLFNFRGLNPVAGRMLGLTGLGSRRLFVSLPCDGEFTALAHKIELQEVAQFPGRVVAYARWEELHSSLKALVSGRTVAMEISADDAVPYLDRVPWGVVELVQRLGGKVVSSAPLVTRFAAGWSAAEAEDHFEAAEILADVARQTLAEAVHQGGTGLSESALQARVVAQLGARGLVFDHPPIVAFGANAAKPHYEPVPGEDAVLAPDQVVLLDLWGGRSPTTVFADQTWMGFSGRRPPERVARVWSTVRDAREAAAELFTARVRSGTPVTGAELDRAARAVIERAGFGEWFVHRTGHSIDRDLHGSGPHLDSYETLDERFLVPGVGFSIEPGIYLPGEFGVRSEIDGYWSPAGARLTPAERQHELILG